MDGDAFLADQHGEEVNLAVDWLNLHTEPLDTLTVLPEGLMINYLARRRNSTAIADLKPLDMHMFGEERILRALKAAPPTYIALVHRDSTLYGGQFFGKDYCQSIFRWIVRNYHPVHLIGAEPLRDHRFGIRILKYKGHLN